VLQRGLAPLVEARGVARAEAEAAEDRARRHEVAARHSQERDVVAVFLEWRVESPELHQSPAIVLESHPGIALRERGVVAVEEELGLQLEDGAQTAAKLLVPANAEARIARLHFVARDDRSRTRGSPGECRNRFSRLRGSVSSLANDLRIELAVKLDDLVGIGLLVLAAPLLRERAGCCERRADC